MGLPLPTPLTIFILLMLTVQGNKAATVETVSSVLLQKGTRGLVPCQVNTTAALSVFWSKSELFTPDDLLVYMDLTEKPYYRGGPWFEDGTFNITNDLTLVIGNVKWTDAIVYFCTVYGQVDDSYTQRQTNTTVFALPTEQFPVIETCILKRTGKATTIQQNCTLYESSPGRNVSCSVDGYFPTTTLYFRHQSETLTPIASSDWTNENGTYGRSITIMANASFYYYECVCLAYGETDERTSTILIRNYNLPKEPFPVIESCYPNPDENTVSNEQNCTIYESSPGRTVTCSVDGYFPTTTLYFRHHSETLTSIASSEWTNEDGTYGRSITIMAKASFYHYECVCIAFGETAERTSTILIRNRPFFPYFNKNGNKTGYLALLFPILLFSGMMYVPVRVILKKRYRRLYGICGTALSWIRWLILVIQLVYVCVYFLGIVYSNDCSIEMIPLYLTIFGSVGTIICMFFMSFEDYQLSDKCVLFAFMNFLLASTIGGVFIYSAYYIVQTEDKYDNHYCHPVFYYFSFSFITLNYILIGLMCYYIMLNHIYRRCIIHHPTAV